MKAVPFTLQPHQEDAPSIKSRSVPEQTPRLELDSCGCMLFSAKLLIWATRNSHRESESLWSRFRNWASPERLKGAQEWLGRGLMLAMFAYLCWRLSTIGLNQLWAARPTSAPFYLLVLLGYLVLPMADTLIYSRLWRLRHDALLPIMLRKRVLNFALIGYSGELLLMLWARGRVPKEESKLAHDIKDVNILSAIVAAVVCALVLLLLVLHAGLGGEGQRVVYAIYALAFPLIIIGFLAAALRLRLMRLPPRSAAGILAIHGARFLIGQLLLLAQWHVALPSAALGNLFILLAVQMAVARLPLLPNRDLLFIGMGIGLAGTLALPQAAVASLLVMTSAIQQILHLIVYLATSLWVPRHRLAIATP